jgi:hypothetical protein
MTGPTRRLVAIVALVTAALGASGCGSSTAVLTFRPRTGLHLRYRVDVRSMSTTVLEGHKPQLTTETTSFTLDQRVVEAGPQGATVAVELRPDRGRPQRFTARLDQAGQLAAVDQIEGVPAGLLGRLGIAELFPSIVLAPPAKGLAAGARWSLRQPVALPDRGDVTLRGHGRLVAFSLDQGVAVARVAEVFSLPVRQKIDDASGAILLDGTEATSSTTSRSVSDGTIVSGRARTTGRFAMTVAPPRSAAASPGTLVRGTMSVEVRSTTRRVH